MFPVMDICFMCLTDNNSSVGKKVITQVEYLLSEITIIKLGIPLRICSICEETLQSFSKFKKASIKNSLRLEMKIKRAQRVMNRAMRVSSTRATQPQADADRPHAKDKDETPEIENESCADVLPEIVEDPLQETPQGRQFYDNVLPSTSREEFITDYDYVLVNYNDYQSDGINNNSATSDPDIMNTKNLRSTQKGPMKVHNAKQDFPCKICDKIYERRSHLNRHKQIHTKIKDYQYDICNKLRRRTNYLKKIHTNTTSKDELISDYVNTNDSQNDVIYDSTDSSDHETEKSKNLRSKQKGLMKAHNAKNNFSCNICEKIYKQKSHLSRHMKTHTETKDYHCYICDKLFTRSDYLKVHMKTHAKMKDFKCTICNKLFTQISHLKTHMKSHNEIRNYKCEICNKLFKLNSHLKSHMVTHTQKKEFKCPICYKLFTLNSNLKRHIKKTHTDT